MGTAHSAVDGSEDRIGILDRALEWFCRVPGFHAEEEAVVIYSPWQRWAYRSVFSLALIILQVVTSIHYYYIIHFQLYLVQ